MMPFFATANNLDELKNYPALVKAEEQGYLKIKSIEPVTELDNKMAAFVQTEGGDNLIYWLDTKEHYINTGALILNNGVNLTNRYMAKMRPSIKEGFNEVYKKGIVLGDSNVPPEKSMYVFYEPFCGYCKKLHRELEPYIKEGLNVKIIPVSFLSSQSPNIIATLSKSDDLYRDLVLSDSKMLKVTANATPELMAKIDGNFEVMKALGINGTPGVVYVADDGKYQIGRGMTGASLDKVALEIMNRK